MLAGLSPARRRLMLTLPALGAVVCAAFIALLVWRPPDPALPPAAQERPGPVLLVPGYGGGTASLQVMAERLTTAGRDATVVALPGSGTGHADPRYVRAAAHRADAAASPTALSAGSQSQRSAQLDLGAVGAVGAPSAPGPRSMRNP